MKQGHEVKKGFSEKRMEKESSLLEAVHISELPSHGLKRKKQFHCRFIVLDEK